MLATSLFYLFSFIIIVSSIGVISTKNPVYAVLFLILAFINAAILFLFLNAEFLAMLLMSILLTFDVTGNTYEENLIQYEFWYSFLAILFVFATVNGALRVFNLVNNYGFKPTTRGLIFPLIGLILVILKIITS